MLFSPDPRFGYDGTGDELARAGRRGQPTQAGPLVCPWPDAIVRATQIQKNTGRYRPVQGLIGTAEIAFIGEPSSTRLLMAT